MKIDSAAITGNGLAGCWWVWVKVMAVTDQLVRPVYRCVQCLWDED